MALFLCFAWVIFISKTIRSLSAWTWAYARFICMASLRRSNLCELKFMLNAVILCYNNPRKSRPSKTGWCPKSCCDYGLFTSNLLDITMARVSNSGRGVGVSMGLGHPGAACPLTLTYFSNSLRLNGRANYLILSWLIQLLARGSGKPCKYIPRCSPYLHLSFRLPNFLWRRLRCTRYSFECYDLKEIEGYLHCSKFDDLSSRCSWTATAAFPMFWLVVNWLYIWSPPLYLISVSCIFRRCALREVGHWTQSLEGGRTDQNTLLRVCLIVWIITL